MISSHDYDVMETEKQKESSNENLNVVSSVQELSDDDKPLLSKRDEKERENEVLTEKEKEEKLKEKEDKKKEKALLESYQWEQKSSTEVGIVEAKVKRSK